MNYKSEDFFPGSSLPISLYDIIVFLSYPGKISISKLHSFSLFDLPSKLIDSFLYVISFIVPKYYSSKVHCNS